jgi:hypothetical protein
MGRTAVEDVIGEPTMLFRPPYGAVTTKAFLALRQGRLTPCLWSMDLGDWHVGATTESLFDGVSGMAGGDVLILHDGSHGQDALLERNRSATIDLIALLLPLKLVAKFGYRERLTFGSEDWDLGRSHGLTWRDLGPCPAKAAHDPCDIASADLVRRG